MTGSTHPGRFLLPSILVFENRDKGMYASGKMLPFILEELVSRGISEIVVVDRWRYKDTLLELSPILTKALRFADDEQHRKLSARIFAPLFEELGIEVSGNLGSFTTKHSNSDDNDRIVRSCISACIELPTFLTAMSEKSHCHFSISSMTSHLDCILEESRSPEMRASAAVLRGIFSNYQEATYGALKSQTSSATEMVSLFESLLETTQYKSLSGEVGKLGSATANIPTIKGKISRFAKEIVQSKFASGAFNFGTTVITHYTGVPLPKAELAEALIKDKYLPPAVDISLPIQAARRRMIGAYPEVDFLGKPERKTTK